MSQKSYNAPPVEKPMPEPFKTRLKTAAQELLRSLGFEVAVARKGGTSDFVIFDRNLLSSYFKPDRRRRLYDEALDATGMRWSDHFSKQCRYYSLAQLVEKAVKADPDADAAECGCWKGHSTHLIASLLRDGGFRGRLRVFDSFEGGLSDLGPEDRNERAALTPEQVAAQKALFASTEEEVRRALAGFGFVDLYKGWIPERFPEAKDRRFSFVHLDVDLYQPIKDSLDFFFPRLIDGGIIAVDDYGLTQFPGAKKAVDESSAAKGCRFFYEVPTGGAFIVK